MAYQATIVIVGSTGSFDVLHCAKVTQTTNHMTKRLTEHVVKISSISKRFRKA